ncbi:hypothetical protein PG988_000324 [Apiospora saccharicola]
MTPNWLDTAKQSLEEDGFIQLQDYEVGKRIEVFQSKGFPYKTVLGLEFIETVIFDPRIRDILRAFPGKFILGHRLRYTAKPGRYHRFWPGGPRAFFVVHQWARESEVEYWTGSHRVELQDKTQAMDEALPEYTRDELIATGCKPKKFLFPNGGLIIADARIFCEHQIGYEFATVFFPPELLPPSRCDSRIYLTSWRN